MRTANRLATFSILLSLSAVSHAAQRHSFNLPAGRLGDVAVTLGHQARISIGVRDPELASRRVRAVRGTLSVEQALDRMLRGSGARAMPIGKDLWLIVTAPGSARGAVRREQKRRAPAPVRKAAPDALPPAYDDPAEIVVTGAKRRILLAAYPGAATLIDGRDPVLEGLRGSDALVELVPAITSTHLGAGRNKLFLRGIADSSFNGPTQATVGQYLGETRLNYNAPDPDLRLFDLQRVEILPGPQGTLYGAGSLGGIIRNIPNSPRLDGVQGAAALGASVTRHGDLGADGGAMLNLPIIKDRIGLRIVGYVETEGGYIDDLQRGLDDVNRTRTVGGRVSLRARSGNGWTMDLGLTGQRISGDDAQFADRQGPPLTRRSAVQQDYYNSYLLADVVLSKSWEDLRLVTAAGIVRQKLFERYDSTRRQGPPRVFEQGNHITMLSADTRLSREKADGTGWLLGTSFISNSSRQERRLGHPEKPVPITGVGNAIEEATLYGEATLKLSEPVRLTAGGRLTHANLAGEALDAPVALAPLLGSVEASREQTDFLPSLALTAKASDGLNLFLRYQQGFRPGGLAVIGEVVQRFRNDRVASVEGGARFSRADGLLDLVASVGYTRWRDIQADVIDFAGMPTTRNIGDGRIWTADFRAEWRPLQGLSFDAGALLNWSRVTDPVPTIVISGSASLPNVARVNARFGAAYEALIGNGHRLRVAGSARYVGKSRLGVGAFLGEAQGNWLDTRLGAWLEAGNHAWSLTLSNLLDEAGNRFALGSPFTLTERRQITPLRPRTIRLGWETRF